MHKSVERVDELVLSSGRETLCFHYELWNAGELGLHPDSTIYFVALGRIFGSSASQCPHLGK